MANIDLSGLTHLIEIGSFTGSSTGIGSTGNGQNGGDGANNNGPTFGS